MTINKRTKKSRQRGSWTHGGGAKKKRRGSGNRGGKGMAGSGKRGDAKKPMVWKNKKYAGKFGFKSKSRTIETRPINVEIIEKDISKWKKEGEYYTINLGEFGFNKLLGKGKVKNKFKITVMSASKKAIDKIKNSGGEVIVQKAEVKKKIEPEREVKVKEEKETE